ncbi:glycosyltransferase family 4 protein [Crocosphaera sp. Alani8]|uniref:glycosyltransferase family 4 protein n=1 Tax=Crocosphaera sp. Alani8 TaxID=3038952 RepID=UPI00313B6262
MKSKIKTLFLTRYLPYPPLGGAALRNWQNINIMKDYGPVCIVSIGSENISAVELPGIECWEHLTLNKSINTWENYRRKLWPIRPFGYPDIDILDQGNIRKRLRNILYKFSPDVVIVEELWTYHYLKVIKAVSCKIILDNHNVEADLLQQNYGKLKLKLPRLKAIEKNFIRQSNQVWVCSEDDKNLLNNLYGSNKNVYTIPNTINVNNYNDVYQGKQSYPSNLAPSDHNILFLGQYNYPPNAIAADILLETIYPQVKQHYPDTKLLLVGRNANSRMQQASKEDPNIIVTGSVPDVRPYLAAASVMVVPLQKGGGTRLKILEALASGCPVISTSKGAEGIEVENGVHLLIKDTPEDIIKGIFEIWNNPSFMISLREKSLQLVKSQYSWEAITPEVEKLIAKLVN